MAPAEIPGREWQLLYESAEKAMRDIPLNKSRKLEIAELEICLSRTANGFFAVQDNCPHLGDSLSRGTCNYLSEVVCPWHSYRFSLITGEETTGHGLRLQTYPVSASENGVFIALPVKPG